MKRVEGHEDHRVALTSGVDINGSEIGLSSCLTCMAVVREVRLCGHPTHTRGRRPCRAFIADDLNITGCPRHRQATPKASPAKPETVRSEAQLLAWFHRERMQWYTLNDIIDGTGVSERTCKRWLPLLVARGHLIRVGSVGRTGMRYQLSEAAMSSQTA